MKIRCGENDRIRCEHRATRQWQGGGWVTKSSYGCILPCSVFMRYTLASTCSQSGRQTPCEYPKWRIDKGMGGQRIRLVAWW
jgi:rRNA maturation protein Nop10